MFYSEAWGTITLMAEGNSAGGNQPAPGQVIAPGGAPQPAAPTPSPAPVPPPENKPSPPPPPPPPPQPEHPPAAAPFSEEAPQQRPPEDHVTWTASEFIAHDKSAGWYFGLAGAAIVIAGLVYLVTRDTISALVVLVAAFALGILGARKPRQLQYQLSFEGVQVGSKYYDFNAFRSFSVVPEGAFSSVVFMPLKRFAPLLTIYYAPEDEEKIINLLSNRLPFEERKADAVDSLMRHIRF